MQSARPGESQDGLIFYRRIVDLYKNKLKEGGFFAFEIGFDQAEDLMKIAAEHGFSASIIKDYSQWQNVIVGSDIRDKYGVKGVPAHFLIDCSTGKVLIADTWTHRTLNWSEEIVNLFEEGK